MATGLQEAIAADHAIHLCVDMQRLFAEDTPWRAPWLQRILPVVAEIAERHAARTIFTRYIPPRRAEDAHGQWRSYYERWAEMTRERLPAEMLDLVAPLGGFCPPARIWNKPVYSPFASSELHMLLQAERVDTLVVTGGETDVCVLASVLGGVDLGYRVVLVKDALCSVSDQSHDSMMELFGKRYGQLVELCESSELRLAWNA